MMELGRYKWTLGYLSSVGLVELLIILAERNS